MEIFNEATIFLVGVLLAPYSANYFDAGSAATNSSFGWIMVALTLFNLLVNEGLMILQIFYQIY